MTLSLKVLRCPENVTLQSRTVEDGVFSIGRGPENSWMLPDPERYLSKRHCVLHFHSGVWKITDHSTNGTFLNGDSEPMGRSHTRQLNDGDRVHLGTYEIEIRVHDRPPARPHQAAAAEVTAAGPEAMLHTKPTTDQLAGTNVPRRVELPADWDDIPSEPVAKAGHRAVPVAGPKPAGAAGVLLPEDWNLDGDHAPDHHGAAPSAAAPHRHGTRLHGGSAGGDLLAALMHGAKLHDVMPANPTAAMEALGATFREMVHGLRQLMAARAALKAQFSIEQTTIRSRGNNPLKFATTDEEALAALLGKGRRSDMGPADSVAEAFSDMRQHEAASLAAMQVAVRHLFAELDPERLRGTIGESGFSILSLQRKARAWDAFETEYARLAETLASGFDNEFGKAFSEAYEEAIADSVAKERHR